MKPIVQSGLGEALRGQIPILGIWLSHTGLPVCGKVLRTLPAAPDPSADGHRPSLRSADESRCRRHFTIGVNCVEATFHTPPCRTHTVVVSVGFTLPDPLR